MQSLQEIWKRIETQLRIEAWSEKRQVSDVPSDFQPGATEEEIQAVEIALGIAFPEDVKASYHIHNGSNRQALIGDPDQNLWELCSLRAFPNPGKTLQNPLVLGRVR